MKHLNNRIERTKMKYIRTEDGIILNLAPFNCGNNEFGTYMGEDARQADTIEELMMIGDLVFKTNGDIFVIPNQAYIDYYIKHKSVSKLFIEDSNGNYIKVAQKETKEGELELL